MKPNIGLDFKSPLVAHGAKLDMPINGDHIF